MTTIYIKISRELFAIWEDELEEYLVEGYEIGIEVGFKDYKEKELLEQLMSEHDFEYEYLSGVPYKKGLQRAKKINKLKELVSKESFEELLSKYKPN